MNFFQHFLENWPQTTKTQEFLVLIKQKSFFFHFFRKKTSNIILRSTDKLYTSKNSLETQSCLAPIPQMPQGKYTRGWGHPNDQYWPLFVEWIIKIPFFTDIWYPFCRRLLRPAGVTFFKTDWRNSNVQTSWSHKAP